ncbi:MAG TPA: pilus assembly protein TadG-related protein [Polyangia bacterium]|jgi:Flp pilus assembly protein TadG
MRTRRRHPEAGATAVLFAILLFVIGGFLALSLNMGHQMAVRAQLQNACDAAALAGARELDGTQAGLNRARDRAFQFAELHRSDKVPVVIDRQNDIILGTWDFEAPKATAFSPATAATSPVKINAVSVRDGREAARGSALAFYFYPLLSGNTRPRSIDVRAAAVAVGGGPCSGCALPFVLADCQVVQPDGTLKCNETLKFSSATVDNIGFTNLADGVHAVNPPTIISILKGGCKDVGYGDHIGVQNGNDLTPQVQKALTDYLDQHGWQNPVLVPIVHPDTCPDPQFNRLQEVVGMASIVITGVHGQPHRSIDIQVKCDQVRPEPAGCENFGTTSPKVRLVR